MTENRLYEPLEIRGQGDYTRYLIDVNGELRWVDRKELNDLNRNSSERV